ncbi:Uncharacterized protein ALO81_02247 [Pseudomonas cannabina]|uniref:Uncharacterized protein n=1 Tax=Pseudomonas cannabina TaxID=86840 RepID=A0A0N8QVI5_PSECA|nr:Uncharacterized protein ALO81_02247 [Pseudomonas cannabina]
MFMGGAFCFLCSRCWYAWSDAVAISNSATISIEPWGTRNRSVATDSDDNNYKGILPWIGHSIQAVRQDWNRRVGQSVILPLLVSMALMPGNFKTAQVLKVIIYACRNSLLHPYTL